MNTLHFVHGCQSKETLEEKLNSDRRIIVKDEPLPNDEIFEGAFLVVLELEVVVVFVLFIAIVLHNLGLFFFDFFEDLNFSPDIFVLSMSIYLLFIHDFDGYSLLHLIHITQCS